MTRSDANGSRNGSQTWRQRASGRTTLSFPNDEAYVYIAWGMDRKHPLYVGKTRAFHRRMSQHERLSAWWPYVREFDLYSYRTEADALIAEYEAIEQLRPEYNEAGNHGKPPPLVRYLRHRIKQPPSEYGPPLTFEEIPADQLAIIRRVQNRGAA